MKVKDLQQQLSKLDPDYDVICYAEDEYPKPSVFPTN